MQKNGIFKTYVEEQVTEKVEDYTGMLPDSVDYILSDPDVELMSKTEEVIVDEDGEYYVCDMTVKRTTRKNKIIVESIPPEEFRLNRMHNSVDLSGARFQAHVSLKTESDLILEGFDKDIIQNLPSNQTYDDDRDYRFYMQGEIVYPEREVTNDKSQRYLEIAECFIHIDINNDGVGSFKKITTAGGDWPDAILSIEDVDDSPFTGTTTNIMSHKFFGLSVYDRLKEIQDQKTTLWRNILDNVYQQNNGRMGVLEGQVNLDDMLVNRPGGVVRMKARDAIVPLKTPPVGAEAFQMLDYLDQVRAGRVGVDPNGKVDEVNIGDRVGSEGIEKIMNAKEEITGLMIRVFAEIGIKPVCVKIRDLAHKHYDAIYDYKFRGDWIKTQPSKWAARSNTTVRVGTGSGNRTEQINVLTTFMALQEKIIANPSQTLVDEPNVYNTIADFGKWQGLKNIDRYFIDPLSDKGMQKKQQNDNNQKQMTEMRHQLEGMQAKAQADLGKAEVMKAEAAQAQVRLKEQVEMSKMQLEQNKALAAYEEKMLRLQLEDANYRAQNAESMAEMKFKYDNMINENARLLTELEAEKERNLDSEYKQNQDTVKNNE